MPFIDAFMAATINVCRVQWRVMFCLFFMPSSLKTVRCIRDHVGVYIYGVSVCMFPDVCWTFLSGQETLYHCHILLYNAWLVSGLRQTSMQSSVTSLFIARWYTLPHRPSSGVIRSLMPMYCPCQQLRTFLPNCFMLPETYRYLDV